ncbi:MULTISPECIES: hypothetical protein [Pseudoalteromonas]|uniref:Uncharacterized protein n=1 Tax=Pseudoalteromonas rubra TaxID=43658 RepID=A0A5S3UU63_9GAMM|nr:MULTISPECIES: hypothetical protein [Pseudoalteromonas]MCG7563757.1 hypothetical protein [Pseudoalteromonas sp. McH1-42]MEC4091117.1 hypothetical protein [Pseudoalteromonas rubra]QPB82340.1 hypothetical protein CWC22_004810 [Pseudoalteromonas rubra]
MKFKKLIASISLVAASISAPAFANYSCKGKVSSVSLGANSRLYASIDGVVSNGGICFLNDSEKGKFCNAVYSSLLVALGAQKEVVVYFSKGTAADCNKGSWVTFEDHGFYHISLKK